MYQSFMIFRRFFGVKKFKNVSEKFGSNVKSRTFAARLRKTATKKFLKRLAQKKKIEKFCKKIWRLKNNAYLCSPFEKNGTESSLKRLLTVQEASTEKQNKFIEKR